MSYIKIINFYNLNTNYIKKFKNNLIKLTLKENIKIKNKESLFFIFIKNENDLYKIYYYLKNLKENIDILFLYNNKRLIQGNNIEKFLNKKNNNVKIINLLINTYKINIINIKFKYIKLIYILKKINNNANITSINT